MGRNMNSIVHPILANWHDFARHAQDRMSESAWAYFDGASGDQISKKNNIAAWQDLFLVPRVLKKFKSISTQCNLLDQTFDWPIVVAPMAHQKWAHPEGESAMALASSALSVGLTLSIQSSTSMQKVATIYDTQKSKGPLWLQLYWTDLAEVLNWIQQAKDSSYQAIVLTVDSAIQGVRDDQIKHGFLLPEAAQSVHFKHKEKNLVSTNFKENLLRQLKQSATWSDIETLVKMSPLPIILKGISHLEDAKIALEIKVAGIVISNHGGRNLDTVASSVDLLQVIAPFIRNHEKQYDKKRSLLLVDGGIRRGTDIVKALALGADAVMIGRPCIYGLACAGSKGVAQILKNIQTEFLTAMGLLGCSSIGEISPEVLKGKW